MRQSFLAKSHDEKAKIVDFLPYIFLGLFFRNRGNCLATPIFLARIDEIAPSLRYCAYNIGDASAKQDLLAMRGGQHGLTGKSKCTLGYF